MDIDEAKQIIANTFSPYDSELEPNSEKPDTFDLMDYKYRDKNGTYKYSQLDINNMSRSSFLILIQKTKKSLEEDCGFVFDHP